MFDQLIQFDQHLFYAVNQGLSNPFFDWLMPLLRNRYFWSPVYLFLAVFLIRNYGKTGWILLLFFAITFSVTDFFCSAIVKPAIERLRPCNDPQLQDEMISLIACGSGYSFPSTHAANHFALGMFLITTFYHKWKWILPVCLLWAISISFAQVYVGVHYPLDIIAGGILGGMIGYVTATVFIVFQPSRKWKPGN